jgi:hypothetical protein
MLAAADQHRATVAPVGNVHGWVAIAADVRRRHAPSDAVSLMPATVELEGQRLRVKVCCARVKIVC